MSEMGPQWDAGPRPDPSEPRAEQKGEKRSGRAGPHVHVGQVPSCSLRPTPPCPAHLPGSHLVTVGGAGRSQWEEGPPLGAGRSRGREPWGRGPPQARRRRPSTQPRGAATSRARSRRGGLVSGQSCRPSRACERVALPWPCSGTREQCGPLWALCFVFSPFPPLVSRRPINCSKVMCRGDSGSVYLGIAARFVVWLTARRGSVL